ncbi:alternative oxidase, mitochondrial isoform X2 [Exaiptasia diaphana]|uniref:Alternative oxidase n=1 Tax=Exaiptasia diaphana TaxID=2652724 RepID=A0A913WZ97_EXADI|nr:alternative oxidase, mitochondrial isoform X2 [Exaiptasia diaphana]
MTTIRIGRVYGSGRLLNAYVALAKQQRACFGQTAHLANNIQIQRSHAGKSSGDFVVSSVPPVRSLFTTTTNQQNLPHFKESLDAKPSSANADDRSYLLPHPIWTEDDVYKVEITHEPPKTKIDKAAYYSVQALRSLFDLVSLYKIGPMTENKWLNRIIMLETVAGVPGMIGGMARHLKSLRKLSRDHGWIHTLLEEAENERMHLMTALELKQPGTLFRGVIIGAQGVFVNMFFIAYLLSPRFCHRFVGYLEEEAVKTYTYCIECIDNGKLPVWKLKEDATMRDVILAIRADEAHHRVVNHTLSSIHLDDPNPFHPGQRKL